MTHTIYTLPETHLRVVKALAVQHSPQMAEIADHYIGLELSRRARYRDESSETLACTISMLASNPTARGHTVEDAAMFCDSMLAELGRRNNRRRDEN